MAAISISLTDDQLVKLVEQLPPGQQNLAYQHLVKKTWGRWNEASQGEEEEARRLAQACGLDWDALSEDERMRFVDELIHSGRGR